MTRSRVRCYPAVFLASLLGLAGCAGFPGMVGDTFTYRDLPVAKTSATAGEGNSVTFRGGAAPLAGPGIKVGDTLRDVQLAKSDLSLINIAETRGTVRIISVVPSLDTPVCEQQTHYLSEKSKGLDKMVELIPIRIDTPFAQKRFAEEAKIDNVTFLSDYRGGDFGKTHGLFLKGPHILARAIMVVDAHNKIRYLQITPELAQMPDMDEAFTFARS